MKLFPPNRILAALVAMGLPFVGIRAHSAEPQAAAAAKTGEAASASTEKAPKSTSKSATAGSDAAAPAKAEPPVKGAKTVRLLTIGNSFSANATRYLGDIAKADGNVLVHKSIVVGGAPLDLHAGKVEANERDAKDKAGLYTNGRSLKQELQADKWDIVTIQQASIKSHDLSTYQPYATQLRDYVRIHAPQAELLIHQTWEYRVDDPRFAKPSDKAGEPKTQDEMYRMLTAAYIAVAEELGLRRIPVGDAFHIVDNDSKWAFHPEPFDPKTAVDPKLPDQTNSLHMGWQWKAGKDGKRALTMDGHHASVAGQYLGACVWYEVLFGRSSVGNKFVPAGIKPDYAQFLQETAHRAVSELPAKKKSAALPKAPGVKASEVDGKQYDLVVIGGTPGGVACAVRAAREGLRVLLVNHTQHLGGFVTSGAGGWEAPYDGLRSPLYAEMREGATSYYRETYGEGSSQHRASLPDPKSNAHIDRPKIEPRIAEMLFDRMVAAEKTLIVLKGYCVDTAERDGALLRAVTLRAMKGDDTVRVAATIFADGMYEGDLAAAAKVPCRVGREARSEYNEPHAGVVYTQDRHKAPGQKGFPMDASEGRLKIRYNSHATGEIVEGPNSGEADRSVMAYNYRLILTRDPANRVMVEKPANYDPVIAKEAAGGGFVPNLPNDKVAWNGGRLIGPQNEYPEADWATRERISKAYLDAMLMRLWYSQNDPSVSEDEKSKWKDYGLAADEFPDNGNLPYEIYVREARRIVGRHVFTEHDNVVAPGLERTAVYSDSIAVTDWPVDSVACLKRKAGSSNLDGIFFLAEETRPAQVPYRSILPQGVDNLLVPVALSASHVGWGAIRLEPVWMQTGEAAGFAASLAIKNQTTPAKLDPDQLLKALTTSHVMVSFFNDVDVRSDDPVIPAVQYFGTKGFFHDYNARTAEPLKFATAQAWTSALTKIRQGQGDASALARAVADGERSERTISQTEFATLLAPPAAPAELKASEPITRGVALQILWDSLHKG